MRLQILRGSEEAVQISLSLSSEHALCFEDSFYVVVKRRKYNTASSYLLGNDRGY